MHTVEGSTEENYLWDNNGTDLSRNLQSPREQTCSQFAHRLKMQPYMRLQSLKHGAKTGIGIYHFLEILRGTINGRSWNFEWKFCVRFWDGVNWREDYVESAGTRVSWTFIASMVRSWKLSNCYENPDIIFERNCRYPSYLPLGKFISRSRLRWWQIVRNTLLNRVQLPKLQLQKWSL